MGVVVVGLAGLVPAGAAAAGGQSGSGSGASGLSVPVTERAAGGTFEAMPGGRFRLTLHGVRVRTLHAGRPVRAAVMLADADRRHNAVAMMIDGARYHARQGTISYQAHSLRGGRLRSSRAIWGLRDMLDPSLPRRFGAASLVFDGGPSSYLAPSLCPASAAACDDDAPAPAVLGYDGHEVQTVTVPAGVNAVMIDAIGGGGGSADDESRGTSGAEVKTLLTVSPGDQLLVSVGGTGEYHYEGVKGKDANGGWGGLGAVGGDGPSTDGNTSSGGAGGGGATTVELLSGEGTTTPEVIAGGGGGQGGEGVGGQGGQGGYGGDPANGNGKKGGGSLLGGGGSGGRQGALGTFAGGFGASVGGVDGNGGGGGGGGHFVTDGNGAVQLTPGGGQGGGKASKGASGGGGAAGLSDANPHDVVAGTTTIATAGDTFVAKNGQVTLTWQTK